jgi:hypothetical protein
MSLSPTAIENCERQIAEFQRTGTIACPNERSYFRIMAVLRERRRSMTAEGDLLGAGETDRLMRQISDFYLESKLYAGKAEKTALHERQLESEARHLHEVEAKWERAQETVHEQHRSAQKRVSDASATFLGRYDDNLPDTLPPEFTRLSSELLDLKAREKSLIAARHFEEAAQLHKEFERRQRAELAKRREEYFEHREVERIAIERRNARKRESTAARWANKVEQVRHSMDNNVRPLQMGVGHLAAKVRSTKAEYIGEDDEILRGESYVSAAKESGNIYRRASSVSRNEAPMTMVTSRREIARPQPMTTTKRLAEAEYRQSAETPWRRQQRRR